VGIELRVREGVEHGRDWVGVSPGLGQLVLNMVGKLHKVLRRNKEPLLIMLHGQPHVLFSTRGKVVWRRQSIEIGGWCRVKEAADTQCNGLPIRSHSQKRAQTQHSFAAYHVHTRTRTFAHTHMSDMHTWRGRDKRARMGLRKILVCTREKSNALLIPDGVIHRLLIVLAPHLLSHPARKNKIPCPSHIELHHLSLSLSLTHTLPPPPLSSLSPPSLPCVPPWQTDNTKRRTPLLWIATCAYAYVNKDFRGGSFEMEEKRGRWGED